MTCAWSNVNKKYQVDLAPRWELNTLPASGVVTNDLIRRVYEHKNKLLAGFTKKYNVDRLVYYDVCGSIIAAIEREKQIKGWSRKKKHDLINALNPEWNDLYQSIL